jgi:hypothetical protein
MRRRSEESKRKRSRRQHDPDWFDPEVQEPDLVFNPQQDDPPRRRREENEDEEEHKARNTLPLPLPCDPQAELIDLELRIAKCRYSAAVGRWKVSKRHSIREYVV